MTKSCYLQIQGVVLLPCSLDDLQSRGKSGSFAFPLVIWDLIAHLKNNNNKPAQQLQPCHKNKETGVDKSIPETSRRFRLLDTLLSEEYSLFEEHARDGGMPSVRGVFNKSTTTDDKGVAKTTTTSFSRLSCLNQVQGLSARKGGREVAGSLLHQQVAIPVVLLILAGWKLVVPALNSNWGSSKRVKPQRKPRSFHCFHYAGTGAVTLQSLVHQRYRPVTSNLSDRWSSERMTSHTTIGQATKRRSGR